jgi:2-oxoglutarate dehydrogenase complex dehydrogenase (E1) component-like enzyme
MHAVCTHRGTRTSATSPTTSPQARRTHRPLTSNRGSRRQSALHRPLRRVRGPYTVLYCAVLYYSRSYLSTDETVFKLRLRQLVRAFERRGHEYADLDPLGLQVRPEAPPELDPAAYGFTAADLQRTVVVQPFDGLKVGGRGA